MKKLLSFLRSMKFGIILLVIVMLSSLAGSLIPQGSDPMTYVRAYGATPARIMLFTGLTDIFHTPYFYALEILLCVNLLMCSLSRLPQTLAAWGRLRAQADTAPVDIPLDPERYDRLTARLKQRHYHREDGGAIYTKNRAGLFGSYLTHLAILMVLVFGGLLLATPVITDQTVLPGEAITASDGTVIECESFHIEDDEGNLDYASLLTVISADGSATKQQEIRVNHPLRFGDWVIYQQTYGTAGRVEVYNAANGASEVMYLTDPCFLSIDGQNGVYFNALYPGFIADEEGNYTLVTQSSGSYADPVYSIESISDGMSTSVLAFPDESITIGDITFTFLTPAEYPGLRLKHVSRWLYAGLYIGFGLMVLGLWLCFFVTPAVICVTQEGCAVCSPKKQGLLIELEADIDS